MKEDLNESQQRPIQSLDLRRLKVISALGRGAKGVVFLVKDEELSERFALKVIWRDLIEKKKTKDLDRDKNNDESDQYRGVCFEQQALRSFEHPLLPRLKGIVSTEKIVGYAIDYCPGRDLNSARRRQTENMFSDDIVRFYAAEIVLALEYLHSQGIVYRDLKPENIMIQENGHIMLVDFDLSTKLSPKTPDAPPTKVVDSVVSSRVSVTRKRRSIFHKFCSSGISPEYPVNLPETCTNSVRKADCRVNSDSSEKSNSFVGTEEYVAPEIILGSGHDFSVDWWSLGIVLYEMLYGATPFKGINRKETFYRILCKPAELVGEPTSLRDLIGKLLEKDPTKRIDAEDIKGHDFFKGVDWDYVLEMPRPPYIPSWLESENESEGKEGIEIIDMELFVKGIFASTDEGEKNEVAVDEKNQNNGGESVRIDELNHHPCEAANFSVF